MLMRKNVDNDARKDSPKPRKIAATDIFVKCILALVL